MPKNALFFFLFFFKALVTSAQTDWKLSNESEGIDIYTGSVAGSKIRAVKVECDFKASLSAFVAVLLDVKNSPEWLYHTSLCRVVKQVSPGDIYYYSVITLPWPAQNRDFVCHLTVSQDTHTKIVTVNGPAIPGIIPVKADMVRVSNSASLWTISPEANGMLKVRYTLHVDPQGDLPAWLVNMFGTEGPLQIFKNLKKELEKPAYKKAVLPFIEN